MSASDPSHLWDDFVDLSLEDHSGYQTDYPALTGHTFNSNDSLQSAQSPSGRSSSQTPGCSANGNAPTSQHQQRQGDLRPDSGSSRSLHYFHGARNFRSYNSNFTFIGGDQTNFGKSQQDEVDAKAMTVLQAHCAPSALFDAKERFDVPPCAAETREAALQSLIDWVNRGDLHSLLGWLRGPAGAGKSTIAQSLAIELKRLGLLAASFFFSRTGSVERRDGDRLIPTIVFQLVSEFPELRPHVVSAITKDPFLFERTRRTQMERLLLEPDMARGDSDQVNRPWDSKARLILIDGLDECSDPAVQVDLIRIIADAASRLAHPFRFLIVSRPEEHITSAFECDVALQYDDPLRMNLDDDPDVEDDMRYYLDLEFRRMLTHHPYRHTLHLVPQWPPPGTIEKIMKKATKQFIYPATTIRFVWSSGILPLQALQMILDLDLARQAQERPLAHIDELYTFIFSKVSSKHLVVTSRLLSLLVYSPEEMKYVSLGCKTSPDVLEKYLRLQAGELPVILKPLLSLIQAPQNGKSDVRVYHASLFDFLKDSTRSAGTGITVSEGRAYETMAWYWWEVLQTALNAGQDDSFARWNFLKLCASAELTGDLMQAIRDYSISPSLLHVEQQDSALIYHHANLLFDLLDFRFELFRDNFPFHEHHTRKLLVMLEHILEEKKVLCHQTFDERLWDALHLEEGIHNPPALQFQGPLLTQRYRLYTVLVRLSIICWPSTDFPNVAETRKAHAMTAVEAYIIVVLGQDDHLSQRYLTLEYIRTIYGNLHVHSNNGYLSELCDVAQRTIQTRLQRLSHDLGLESSEVKELLLRFEDSNAHWWRYRPAAQP